jgi:hypothetical protein
VFFENFAECTLGKVRKINSKFLVWGQKGKIGEGGGENSFVIGKNDLLITQLKNGLGQNNREGIYVIHTF